MILVEWTCIADNEFVNIDFALKMASIFDGIIVSEVFTVEDPVAFPKHVVSLGSEVILFSQVAHIKEFFVMLLKKPG